MTELVSYLTRQRAHTPQEKVDNKQKPKEVSHTEFLSVFVQSRYLLFVFVSDESQLTLFYIFVLIICAQFILRIKEISEKNFLLVSISLYVQKLQPKHGRTRKSLKLRFLFRSITHSPKLPLVFLYFVGNKKSDFLFIFVFFCSSQEVFSPSQIINSAHRNKQWCLRRSLADHKQDPGNT